MKELIDFGKCKKIEEREFPEVCSKKIAIEYNGVPYMLKYPKSQLLMGFYDYEITSSFSEHIACKIFAMLGLPVQETKLGFIEENGNQKILVACKDLETPNLKLQTFLDTMSFDNGITRDELFAQVHDLPLVLKYLQDQHFVDVGEIKKYFWQIFVVDAFLANTERSLENFGYLFDTVSNKATLAPVFDCGDCLTPTMDDVNMAVFITNVELNVDLYRQYVYGCADSIFTMQGQRLDYFDYLMHTEDRDCLAAAQEIISKIDMQEIAKMIDEELAFVPLRRDYYKILLQERYNLLMLPVLQRVKENG